MPPAAPTTGTMAVRRWPSSPERRSRPISRPTTKKKTAMRPPLIHDCTEVNSENTEPPTCTGCSHTVQVGRAPRRVGPQQGQAHGQDQHPAAGDVGVEEPPETVPSPTGHRQAHRVTRPDGPPVRWSAPAPGRGPTSWARNSGNRRPRPSVPTAPCTVTAVARVSSADLEEVADLERGAGEASHGHLDVDHLVEAEGQAVADVQLEHGEVHPLGAELVVGVAGMAEQRRRGPLRDTGVSAPWWMMPMASVSANRVRTWWAKA